MSSSSISPSGSSITELVIPETPSAAPHSSAGISVVPPGGSNDDFQNRVLRADSWTPEFIQEAMAHTSQHSIVDDTAISPQETIAAARATLHENTYTLSLLKISSWREAVHRMISYEPQVKSSISTTLQEIQAHQDQEVSRLKKTATTAIDAYENLILRASEHANEAISSRPLLADASKISAAKKAMQEAVATFKHAHSPAHYIELLHEAVQDLVCYPAIEFFQKRATSKTIANLSTYDKIPLAIGTSTNPRLVLDDSNPASLTAGAIQTAIELRTARMLATLAVHVAKECPTSDSASATRAHSTLAEINKLLDSRIIEETIFNRAGVSLSSARKDEEEISQILTPVKRVALPSSFLKTPKNYPRTHVRL